MRAVEGAHTQMHDAYVDEGGVIGEALDGLEREPVHHAAFRQWISAMMAVLTRS